MKTFLSIVAILLVIGLVSMVTAEFTRSHRELLQEIERGKYRIETRDVAVPAPSPKGPFHIKAYDGGVLIGEWMTKPGTPMEYEGDVLSFVDDITGLPVAIKANGICTDYTEKPEAAEIRARLGRISL